MTNYINDVNQQYHVQATPSVLDDEEKKRNPNKRNAKRDDVELKCKEKMVCALALLQVEKLFDNYLDNKKGKDFKESHQACELPSSTTSEKARFFFTKEPQ